MDQRTSARPDRIRSVHASRGEFIVPAEFIKGMLPAVALVDDEGLEDRQRDRLRGRTIVFDSAACVGNSPEQLALGEKPSDLELGVDAGFEPAKQFQQQAPSIEDKCIA